MAMSVTESNALNTLLDWLLNVTTYAAQRPLMPFEAMESAAFLAGSANKRLGAGLDAGCVRRLWQQSPPRAANCKRRPPR